MLVAKAADLRLNGLVDGALDNLRHSLGQRVLMLNPEQREAAGTTNCISCFKDRSQSPIRGEIGTLHECPDSRLSRAVSVSRGLT